MYNVGCMATSETMTQEMTKKGLEAENAVIESLKTMKSRGGYRCNSGRKANVVKIVEDQFAIAKAEYWAKIAQDVVMPRLLEIIKNEPASSRNLMVALQEVLNRALGKPTERVQIEQVRVNIDL